MTFSTWIFFASSLLQNCINQFTALAQSEKCRFIGNVCLGKHVTLAQLRPFYHAIVMVSVVCVTMVMVSVVHYHGDGKCCVCYHGDSVTMNCCWWISLVLWTSPALHLNYILDLWTKQSKPGMKLLVNIIPVMKHWHTMFVVMVLKGKYILMVLEEK